MEITQLPPVNLSPVEETSLSWQYLEGQDPVDFTDGWSAEFLIESCGNVVFRTAPEMTDFGLISVTVPAEVAQQVRSARRIDARYQARISSPISGLNLVWQGSVVVLEII